MSEIKNIVALSGVVVILLITIGLVANMLYIVFSPKNKRIEEDRKMTLFSKGFMDITRGRYGEELCECQRCYAVVAYRSYEKHRSVCEVQP